MWGGENHFSDIRFFNLKYLSHFMAEQQTNYIAFIVK